MLPYAPIFYTLLFGVSGVTGEGWRESERLKIKA